jgi:type I restriction enzyme R subunit
MPQSTPNNNENSNFGFLKEHDPLFFELANSAEQAFVRDPNTTLIKMRQFGEAIAQDLATRCGITFDERVSQSDLLYQVSRELSLDPDIRNVFHTLRIAGNKAAHQFRTQHKEALEGLKLGRGLAVWYHQAMGKNGTSFKAGPFIPPSDPSQHLRDLQAQIAELRTQLSEATQQVESNQQLTDLLSKEKEEYATLAYQMETEANQFSQQAKAHEAALKAQQTAFENRLADMNKAWQEESDATRKMLQQQRDAVVKKTASASKSFSLNEELTRILIDEQLREAGWEADTEQLDWRKGARPEKGHNRAIAECPTYMNGKKGRADYLLFIGLTPVAAVEAKKENVDVSGKIRQAERYAYGFNIALPLIAPWTLEGRTQPWDDRHGGSYQLPFVYSCNGREYVPQLAEKSGIWFRDVRHPSNLAHALSKFHTPEGLLDKLKRQREAAEAKLEQEGFGYLKLRDYQQKAIQAVEVALANNQRNCLLAMATGTGKTRTIIGLMYRFLKTERFKRILFLVDRTALGDQSLDAFKEMPLEQGHSLFNNYIIAELGDITPAAETRIQVATVQAMVSRIFASDTPLPLDSYDCIIVDEAHRGYTLDQEMTDGELATRDAAQYLSAYRRVIDYFDAVKIGLTATPAKHTSEIFGKPVYTYSYREAVADDWLIDHEPPIRYGTLLSQKGINFVKGEQVEVINTLTGEIETSDLDDELSFDVSQFNKQVINDDFNRVICEQLANELDPFGPEKTMIFCATDNHADMVKRLLSEAFKEIYGESYNEAAVEKITGKSDQVDKLIRRYKNEQYPNVAITVDLLTTGIDVPAIAHLVFMRRVRSRILYEQMIGRATRRCDDIGKTVFKIYDPVDIYATLQDVTTMKPLVKDPNITLEQLASELTTPALLENALNTKGEQPDSSHADDLLNQFSQKVMRILRKAKNKAETKPAVREKLREMASIWGVEPEKLHQHFHTIGPKQTAQFIQQHGNLLNQLDEISQLIGSDRYPVISHHEDEFLLREQTYGAYAKPEDYLDSFSHFVQNQINQSAALAVVVNKPRDLTREQLREIKLLLDGAGFSEAKLQTAWRQQTNQDIAASIIGHIRRAALGEPLLSFEQRVANAMMKIYAAHSWTPPQRKWLERLAKQLTHEVVIDSLFINDVFANTGGVKGLNKLLNNQLDIVIDELNTYLWQAS